ncbi:amino-acid N-acetyltransferase, partial [bacterium]|nr:amino-acid N-acetyltransferase [bacterium]
MKLTDLRGILQYIPRFRDRVFVISLDGAVVAGENFSNLLLDIALLRSLNIRPVLVHGAAHQIQALSSATRQSPSDTDGTGITDTGTLETAIHASSMVTHAILQGLSISDLRGAASNAIIAHPRGIIQGVDQQCTGKVERVDTQLLEVLINQQIIPVIAPLGFDGEGHTFRVNSDAVALSVAKALKATKLIFITTQNGLIFEDSLIRQMAVNELDQRL